VPTWSIVLGARVDFFTGLPLTASVLLIEPGLTVFEGVLKADFFDFSDSGV
jgi:hypothetical protein